MKNILVNFGKVLFIFRSLLSLFYVGLLVVILALLYKFGLGIWDLIISLSSDGTQKMDIIIRALELVDVTMVAQLVWVVLIAGFYLFVEDNFFEDKIEDKPAWLKNINNYNIKLKLAFAMISVSGVYALKTYLQGELSQMEILITVMIHLLFVVSAIGIALSEYITKKGMAR